MSFLSDQKLIIAPTKYISYWGALNQLGVIVRPISQHITIVGGTKGYHDVAVRIESLLGISGVSFQVLTHRGPCTQHAVAALIGQVDKHSGAIVGVGGGRVIDVAKSIADALDLPCITVPTSPATCSAVTPLSVFYTGAGEYIESRQLSRSPLIALVDLAIISAVPNRLLTAGIIDALAKYYEVRFATRQNQMAGLPVQTALALCQQLKSIIDQHAIHAMNAQGATRQFVAEAAILLPGLIGGLSGTVNKLAAAHAVHNALTHLPKSKRSMHGELVGFGILVQMQLTSEDKSVITSLIHFMKKLGTPCGLHALGCEELYLQDEHILKKLLMFPVMRRFFPLLTIDSLREAIYKAEMLINTS